RRVEHAGGLHAGRRTRRCRQRGVRRGPAIARALADARAAARTPDRAVAGMDVDRGGDLLLHQPVREHAVRRTGPRVHGHDERDALQRVHGRTAGAAPGGTGEHAAHGVGDRHRGGAVRAVRDRRGCRARARRLRALDRHDDGPAARPGGPERVAALVRARVGDHVRHLHHPGDRVHGLDPRRRVRPGRGDAGVLRRVPPRESEAAEEGQARSPPRTRPDASLAGPIPRDPSAGASAEGESGHASEAEHELPPLAELPPAAEPPPAAYRASDLVAFPKAAFVERLAGFTLDAIIIMIIAQFLEFDRHGAPFERLTLFLALAYHVGFWTWKGTTPGGMICQLRVIRTDGRPLEFSEALVRGLTGIISLAIAGLGFLWILRDPDRQAWHDRVAGTYVVKVPRAYPI